MADNRALRCSLRYLQDAAECLGAAGRFMDVVEDPFKLRAEVSTAYAFVDVLIRCLRFEMNVPDEPGHTRED